jgi:hypothetical protein
MISPADAADFLPPTFQILTGLNFAALLVIRFFAGAALRPLWGKVIAFALIFTALGNLLFSQGTAKSTLNGAAEMLTLGGVSFFVSAILVVVGLVLAARAARPEVTR